MLRRLLFMLAFPMASALAAPTPVRKAEPFMLHLILKASDGRALQHGYKAGIDLQTGPITTSTVKDWNGVELVAGDVISLSSHDETVQALRVAGTQKLAWQPTPTQPGTRFVLRKVDGANGSTIATGDSVRFELFGEKDTYLGSNAQLVHVTTPGPEQTWLVRRETYGNQATRKLYSDASWSSVDPVQSKAMYEEAFKLGALDAAGAIGDMYMDGKLGPKDLAQAAAYYRKGAEAGEPSSMFLYGVMLYYGKGVSENKAEAVRWEQNAVRADYTNAGDQLQKWGAPVPGATVATAPVAPPAPPVNRFRYSAGTMLVRDGSPAIYIVEAAGDRYRILTRKYYEPGDYFWTGNEYGRYQIDESWISRTQLESWNLQPADKKYRTCDVCHGEGCVMEQMTSRRGGYNYVENGSVYHVPEYDKPTYKRQQRCGGCGGQGWIPRS